MSPSRFLRAWTLGCLLTAGIVLAGCGRIGYALLDNQGSAEAGRAASNGSANPSAAGQAGRSMGPAAGSPIDAMPSAGSAADGSAGHGGDTGGANTVDGGSDSGQGDGPAAGGGTESGFVDGGGVAGFNDASGGGTSSGGSDWSGAGTPTAPDGGGTSGFGPAGGNAARAQPAGAAGLAGASDPSGAAGGVGGAHDNGTGGATGGLDGTGGATGGVGGTAGAAGAGDATGGLGGTGGSAGGVGGATGGVGGTGGATGGVGGTGGAVPCHPVVDLYPVTPITNDNTLFPTIFFDAADDSYLEVPFDFGFSFTFYADTYTSIFLNNNGGMTFGDGWDDWLNQYTTLTDIDMPGIGVFWGDMDASKSPDRASQMTYQQCPDRFIVTYTQMQDWQYSDVDNTATVQLFADGTIDIQYGIVGSLDIFMGVFDGTHANDRDKLGLNDSYPGYFSTGTGIIVFSPEGGKLAHSGELSNRHVTFAP